jgi:hypothetical protein
MNTRQRGDYTLDLVLDEARARELIDQAEKFVGRVEQYLREEGFVRWQVHSLACKITSAWRRLNM